MAFNEQIYLNMNRLIDAGIPRFLLSRSTNSRAIPTESSSFTGGGKLALDHFMVAYVCLGAGLVTAMITFSMEKLCCR